MFKPTPIFVENTSVVLNATNPGSTLNNRTVVLRVREHVANNVVEVRKIQTIDHFAEPLTKPLVSNDFHYFYHECIVNG